MKKKVSDWCVAYPGPLGQYPEDFSWSFPHVLGQQTLPVPVGKLGTLDFGARWRHHGATWRHISPDGATEFPDRVYGPAVSSNFKKVDSSIIIALPRAHTQPRMPVGNSVAVRLSYDLVMAEIQH